MGNKVKRKAGRILSFLLVFLLMGAAFPQTGAAAAKAKAQTALLRIISTTDLHGQVTTMHYDTASQKTGSLAQIYTLIKQARSEAGTKNTLTLDIGDSVYGYAADYILKHSGEDTLQPIYKAMAMIKYDAVTLGNHDFDYGYSYIDKQLELSGLKDKCVLSNIIRTDTGKTAWNETMIVTKKVKTENGGSASIDIGLVGVTIPDMSTYTNCKEDLAALPIVSTVEKQAAALKARGADLVVVLAHSSFGTTEWTDESNNVVYALTSIDNVDAIAAGHGHKNYPSSDEGSASIYNLPNVDKKTGLMNGMPVTMVQDHGAGLAQIDLNLNIAADGTVTVKNAAASLRMVTKDTQSSASIAGSQDSEIAQVDNSLKDVIGTLPADKKISSYFALLEDNYAIQLVNESKIQYGLAYTGGAGKRLYADYPVVAMTKYTLSGSQSKEDNISLNETITMKDILNMQQDNHNNNIIYWVTGSQLREMLEWSASIYATADGSITSDKVLENLLETRGASSIAAAEWIEDWSAFAVFDGIEYTIDAAKPPRYTKAGALKNASAYRIASLTYNGQPVGADQKFILITHTISSTDASGTIPNQKLVGKTDFAYQQLITYVKQQQEFGALSTDTDNNWNVLFDSAKEYIVRSSVLSQADAELKNWFRGLLSSNETFAYYLAQFMQAEEADTDQPLLVVSSTQTEETDQPVDIKVQASDRSGISQVKWLEGQQPADSSAWQTAETVSGGAFAASKNGVYSILAEDMFHNQTVKYIKIDNINPSVVLAPTINKVSNKVSILSGTARYGTTVHIDAGGNTYEVDALEDDTYTCTVERMNTGKVVTAYCTDASGKRSKTVSTTVFKNGPNMPQVKQFSNKSLKVEGTFTDDASTFVAIVDSDVYIAEADRELYMNSEVYAKSRKVHLAEFTQAGSSFSLAVPAQDAGKAWKFVTLDKAGRKSATLTMETADEAPNIPQLYEICNAETFVFGKATNVNESGTVTVTVGEQQFTGTVAQDGSFAVQTNGYAEGQNITAVVNDVKDGAARTSLPASVKAVSYTKYTNTANIRTQAVYTNSTQVTGETVPGYTVYVRARGWCDQAQIDALGRFTYDLAEPMPAGQKIYIVARNQRNEIVGTAVQQAVEYVPEPVTPQAPETPSVLTSEIKLDTPQIQVLSKTIGTVVMNINGTEYTSQMGLYNQAYDGYIYTLDLPPAEAEQTITIHLISTQGVSSGSVTVMRTKNE